MIELISRSPGFSVISSYFKWILAQIKLREMKKQCSKLLNSYVCEMLQALHGCCRTTGMNEILKLKYFILKYSKTTKIHNKHYCWSVILKDKKKEQQIISGEILQFTTLVIICLENFNKNFHSN